MISKVFGAKARFCNEGCRESFECDRDAGAIYPPHEGPEEGTIIGVEEASIEYDQCAYCGANMEDDPEKDTVFEPEGSPHKREPCPSCEILYINGARCHETECPEGP